MALNRIRCSSKKMAGLGIASFLVSCLLAPLSGLAGWWDEPIPDDIDTANKLFHVSRNRLEQLIEATPSLEGNAASNKGKELGLAFARIHDNLSSLEKRIREESLFPEEKKRLLNEAGELKDHGFEILSSAFAYGHNTKGKIGPKSEIRIVLWGPAVVGLMGRIALQAGLIHDFNPVIGVMIGGLATGTGYIYFKEIERIVDPFNIRNPFFASFLNEVQAKHKISAWHPLRSLCGFLLE